MSVTIDASGDTAIEAAARHISWPSGQFYHAYKFSKTKELWNKWNAEDAYPLVLMKPLKLLSAYENVFTLKHDCIYVENGYARGGLAWSAAYKQAFTLLLNETVPDIVYETSDFDSVFTSMPFDDIGVDDVDTFLELIHPLDEWPTYFNKWNKGPPYMKVNFSKATSYDKAEINFSKLANFFNQKMVINDFALTAAAVAKNEEYDTMIGNIDIDWPTRAHDKNVQKYSERYRLSKKVQYLMRIPGFGFVETPTIQIGQLLDSMSDFERCATSNAILFKAKYARRIARLKLALDVHDRLKASGETEESCVFVLSEYVADELRTVNGNWNLLVEATNTSATCYEFSKDREQFLVTRGKQVDCNNERARMDCTTLNHSRAFTEALETREIYQNQKKWTSSISKKRILSPILRK